MGIQYDGDTNEELMRLARENNRLLKQMRRSSLVGAIVRTIFWIAIIVVPLWFYVEYLAPVVDSMMQTYEQVQDTNAAAQAQFGETRKYLEQLRALYGGQ